MMNYIFVFGVLALYVTETVLVYNSDKHIRKSIFYFGTTMVVLDVIVSLFTKANAPVNFIEQILFYFGYHFLGICGLILVKCSPASGNNATDAKSTNKAVDNLKINGKEFCTNCGKEVESNWKFCNNCGKKLN